MQLYDKSSFRIPTAIFNLLRSSAFPLWIIFSPLVFMFIRYGLFPKEGDGLIGGLEIILLPFYWAIMLVLFLVPLIFSKLMKAKNPYRASKIAMILVTVLIGIFYIYSAL